MGLSFSMGLGKTAAALALLANTLFFLLAGWSNQDFTKRYQCLRK
jgi:hypothetical protein